MERSYRVACLVSHPIQYQAPLFRYLAARPGIELTVFFLSDHSIHAYRDSGFGVDVKWDVPLLDGYRSEFLPRVGNGSGLSFWRPWTFGLRARLRRGQFDALWVHGYAHRGCLAGIAAAKSLSIPVMLRGESNLLSETDDALKLGVKRIAMPALLRTIDAALAIGRLNREFYLRYGVEAGRIFPMPYAVDNEFFRNASEKARPRREALRAELGLKPERAVILFASKMQPHKRAADLLQAYVRLSSDGVAEPAPYLVFAGDGEERASLERRARELKWDSIRFIGFRNQSELPSLYDLCDVFVLPSEHEPWGLVVNEAMNAGKPVVVSDRVGAGPDLIENSVNGLVYPVRDVASLADCLRRLIDSPEHRAAMGARALESVARLDFNADREGLLAALDSVVGKKARAAA
ncbi:MAG TPA: glycosyltransferase family 4 protein [Verrucomicrobiae bacterium]|jgi:glycosyltransferase involved in cell wall biosynthesis|nr:glycosyltransferase family 4 protein [Verrucomicrobiae bacterium]